MSTQDPGMHGTTRVEARAQSDPEVISRQIDHTRESMSGTLDEIQRRLEPEQVSSYVKDVAHYVVLELKAVAGDFARETMSSVRTASSIQDQDIPSTSLATAPRLTDSTRAFLSRYASRQGGRATGEGPMANQTQGLWKKLEANPLALGAVGIAVGSIVGAIAPRLQQEDQIMGEARDRMMDNVHGTAADTVESLRVAAVETGTAVLKEATGSQKGK